MSRSGVTTISVALVGAQALALETFAKELSRTDVADMSARLAESGVDLDVQRTMEAIVALTAALEAPYRTTFDQGG